MIKTKIFTKSNIFIFFMFLILSFILSLFFLWKKPFYADDILFHLNRLGSINNYFSSPNNFNYFHSSGQIINLFYPSITLLPFKLIFKITNNFIFSYKLFIYLIVLVTMYTSYYLGKNVFKHKMGGIILSILYTFSNYFIALVYYRFALGELLSFTFLPIVVLGLYKILFTKKIKWKTLTIGLTLVAYTHVLSLIFCIIIIISITLFCLIKKTLTKNNIKYLLLSCFFAVLLSLATLIPLVEELTYQKIHQPGMFIKLSYQSEPIFNFFYNAITNNIYSRHSVKYPYNHIEMFTFGIIPLIICIYSLIKYKTLTKFEKISFVVLIISIILRLNIIPWKQLEHLKIFSIFQFLFRLNFLITIFSSILGTKFLLQIYENIKIKKLFYVIICLPFVFLIIHFNGMFNGVFKKNIIHEQTFSQQKFIAKIQKLDVLDYINENQAINLAKLSKIKNLTTNQKEMLFYKKSIFINNNVINSKNYQKNIQDNKYNIKITKTCSNPCNLILPISVYKGTKVILNQKEIKPQISNEIGTLIVPLEQNKINDVSVEYNWTPLARISQIISLICWIILIFNSNVFKHLIKKIKKPV